MEMTILDEIAEIVCILIAVLLIGLVGLMAERMERELNERRSKDEKRGINSKGVSKKSSTERKDGLHGRKA